MTRRAEARWNVRADELEPGDVLAEPYLRYRRVEAVRQFNGWVAVEFDPTGSVAFDNDRRVELTWRQSGELPAGAERSD